MKMNCNSPYIKWGMTAFIVLCSTILFFFAIFRMKGLLGSVHLVFQILMPFVYGLVICFVLYTIIVRNAYIRYLRVC